MPEYDLEPLTYDEILQKRTHELKELTESIVDLLGSDIEINIKAKVDNIGDLSAINLDIVLKGV